MTNVAFYIVPRTLCRSGPKGVRGTARGPGPEHTGVRAEVQQQQRETWTSTHPGLMYINRRHKPPRGGVRPCATWLVREIGEISSVVRVCTSFPPRPPVECRASHIVS